MSPIIYKREQAKRKFYNITLIIIAINVLVYLVMLVLQYIYGNVILENIAVNPSYILKGEKLWTIVSSMFMHGSFMHLFVNMLSLMFLGSFLERLIGSKRYAFIYLVSGIIASLAFVFLALVFGQDLNVPAVGASGAIFGIGGMLAILTPRLPIYILFIPIAMPMWIGIILMLALMWIVSALTGLPIGNTAHLGGFIAGLVYGLYLRIKYKKKMRVLDKVFR
ncbi:MAG: rhomboid family intramembrane serine protease [Candidatus Pacearchaeota archaeon]